MLVGMSKDASFVNEHGSSKNPEPQVGVSLYSTGLYWYTVTGWVERRR